MVEKEVKLNGKNIKIVTSLKKEDIESNDDNILLDNTLELDSLVEEIKANDKK